MRNNLLFSFPILFQSNLTELGFWYRPCQKESEILISNFAIIDYVFTALGNSCKESRWSRAGFGYPTCLLAKLYLIMLQHLTIVKMGFGPPGE